MVKSRFLLLFSLFLFIQCAEEKKPSVELIKTPLHQGLVPSNAKPVQASVTNVNCWVDQGKFYVAGICSNTTSQWQKFWLDASPIDASGKPIGISKHSSVILTTFSDAVAPSGRTSFFTSWPLSEFSGKPAFCNIKVAGATLQTPGPILVSPGTSAMKMMGAAAPGQPASVEKAWQITGTIDNALDIPAVRPRLEILIYGTDGLLWFSTLLNPEDPAVKPIFRFDREGPLKPKEQRPFSLQVFYEILPQPLQDKKIGRVEILPFEAKY